MAKKKASTTSRPVANELEEIIQQDLISDRSIPWEDCANQLEQLAAYCSDWARQIRQDHKDD